MVIYVRPILSNYEKENGTISYIKHMWFIEHKKKDPKGRKKSGARSATSLSYGGAMQEGSARTMVEMRI